MPTRPQEAVSQTEVVLLLRSAIDTAISYPSNVNEAKATNLAKAYPKALRSAHVRHNLGQRRWDWLGERGVYPAMDPGEVAGVVTIQGTISPDKTT